MNKRYNIGNKMSRQSFKYFQGLDKFKTELSILQNSQKCILIHNMKGRV